MFLLSLNSGTKPIANKYCEGNLKRIEKSKSKEHEIGQNGTGVPGESSSLEYTSNGLAEKERARVPHPVL